MSKIFDLGFYTGDDIFEFAKPRVIGEGFQTIINSLRNKDKVIIVRYAESDVEQTENYTPELSMGIVTKVFAHVEGNIYTDSNEYLHMVKANLSGQPLDVYLNGVVAQIEESQRILKEQEEKLEVSDGRNKEF